MLKCLLMIPAVLFALSCQPNVSQEDEVSFIKKLPNSAFNDRNRTGGVYRGIVKYFADHGNDLTADVSQLDLAWPMAEEKTAVLTRFGTPIILGSTTAYFHDSLDVYRSDSSFSADVHAPLAGIVQIFDYYGSQTTTAEPYATVVAIWDPKSHLIVGLMHIKPSQALLDLARPAAIEKGFVIGQLAVPAFLAADHQEALRHTHTTIIDGKTFRLLNATRLIAGYHDAVKPVLDDAYLLDDSAKRTDKLTTGKLDLILDLHDNDDDSLRNFEVGAIEFTVKDDLDNVLAHTAKCDLDDLTARHGDDSELPATRLLDLGNAASQTGIGGWPQSDVDNRDRQFRYALTQLKVTPEGECTVVADDQGFMTVEESTQSIHLEAKVWDQRGNRLDIDRTFSR